MDSVKNHFKILVSQITKEIVQQISLKCHLNSKQVLKRKSRKKYMMTKSLAITSYHLSQTLFFITYGMVSWQSLLLSKFAKQF